MSSSTGNEISRAGMDNATFTAALDGAKRGDGPAYRHLYRWLATDLVRYAAIRGTQDPKSVADETLLRAFQQIDRFNGDAQAFRAWVFAVGRNLILDALRAQGAHVKIDESGSGVDVAGLDQLRRAFGPLSHDQRDVVLLRILGRLSLQQVAVALDKPVTAVKALQRRALSRLQAQILAEVPA
ncbi:MAG: RNA polymerase sigma factor [Actinomycetota bacterium]